MTATQRAEPPVQPLNAHTGALWAVRRGLRVFRVAPNGKQPFAGGLREATTDEATVARWFASNPDLNYGIAMGGPDRLVALDCDVKHDSAMEDYIALEHPRTLEFLSGSGGAHVILSGFDASQRDLANATSINVRAEGGYIVGPGSSVNGKRYRIHSCAPVAAVPPHIAARLGRRGEKSADNSTPAAELDTPGAIAYAEDFARRAPAAPLGERNAALYRLAATLKDKGVSRETSLATLLEHWCPRCDPPYEGEGEIEGTVASAYNNGQRQPGIDAPEIEFDDVADPIANAFENLSRVKPSPAPAIRATPYSWVDPEGIPPREWLYGRHLVRKFMSATVAPGGLGKSSLVFVEGVSIATGRALLLDRAPKPGRVWLWNGEDPFDELQRRIQAVCLHFGIRREEIEGRLFVDSGRITPIVIATETRNGAKIAEPVVAHDT